MNQRLKLYTFDNKSWTQHITMPKYYRMTYQVATSIKYTGKTGKNSLTKTMEVYSLW